MGRRHVIETTEVDRATEEQFRDELQVAVQGFWDEPPAANGGPPDRTLVIDLRPVRFIDSSGIRSLVEAEQAMREAGGRLEVIAGPGIVRRTLQVCGVWEHLGGNGSEAS
jgi:anti-anti-sigma factor